VLAVAVSVFTGTENVKDLFATVLGANTAFSGTLVPDAGHAARFTIPVAATIGGHANTANYVLYQTSSSQLVVLETDGAEFALGTLQQQK